MHSSLQLESSNSNLKLQGEQRFELKRHLADTLQGRIYGAIDKTNGDYVVVKETWKQLVTLKKSREGHRVFEDFAQEKKVMNYLSSQEDCHPGFARIIDEWSDENCFFYAMESCQGDLFEYIKAMHNKGVLNNDISHQTFANPNHEWIQTVRHIFRQLVDCVSWMHKKHVCHLDLSLENIMIHDPILKNVKIIDFGLASYSANGNFIDSRRVGKTGYMAPEVFAKKYYDSRKADIWSLGVILFMMLAGTAPYELPTGNCPSFTYIVNGRLREILIHWKRLNYVTEEALDLLTKIFKLESNRITMNELFKHPFVQLDSNPLQEIIPVKSKIYADTKESIDDKHKEVIQDNNNNNNIITNTTSASSTSTDPNIDKNNIDNNFQTNNYLSSSTKSSVTSSSTTPSRTPTAVTSNVVDIAGDNHQIKKNANCSSTTKTIEDNKNDDGSLLKQTTTHQETEFETGDKLDIQNHQFQSIEANDYRRKILEINSPNVDSWRSFANQIEELINNKFHQRREIISHKANNPGEFPKEGVVEEELQITLEIEELQMLQTYLTAKAS